jgi:hypothetical protein
MKCNHRNFVHLVGSYAYILHVVAKYICKLQLQFCVCWTQYSPLSNGPRVAFCFATWIQCVHLGVIYQRFVLIISSLVYSGPTSIFSFRGVTVLSCWVPCSGSAQAVSQRPPFAKNRVHSNSNPRVICGGQNDTGTGFSASTSVLSCQCYSANGPYSLICHQCYKILMIKRVIK